MSLQNRKRIRFLSFFSLLTLTACVVWCYSVHSREPLDPQKHQLRLDLQLERSEFKTSEPVNVQVSIKNVGTTDVKIPVMEDSQLFFDLPRGLRRWVLPA